MIETVKTFEGFSGQNINFQKTKIIGINISTKIIEEFASIYDCKKGEGLNIYLGLPLKENHKFFSLRKVIIEKLERWLSSWSSCFTSKGGRLTLI